MNWKCDRNDEATHGAFGSNALAQRDRSTEKRKRRIYVRLFVLSSHPLPVSFYQNGM